MGLIATICHNIFFCSFSTPAVFTWLFANHQTNEWGWVLNTYLKEEIDLCDVILLVRLETWKSAVDNFFCSCKLKSFAYYSDCNKALLSISGFILRDGIVFQLSEKNSNFKGSLKEWRFFKTKWLPFKFLLMVCLVRFVRWWLHSDGLGCVSILVSFYWWPNIISNLSTIYRS